MGSDVVDRLRCVDRDVDGLLILLRVKARIRLKVVVFQKQQQQSILFVLIRRSAYRIQRNHFRTSYKLPGILRELQHNIVCISTSHRFENAVHHQGQFALNYLLLANST